MLRNFEIVQKYIIYKYMVARPEQTVEENYVLMEIRKDHKLDSHRVVMSAMLLKAVFVVHGAKHIYHHSLSLPA